MPIAVRSTSGIVIVTQLLQAEARRLTEHGLDHCIARGRTAGPVATGEEPDPPGPGCGVAGEWRSELRYAGPHSRRRDHHDPRWSNALFRTDRRGGFARRDCVPGVRSRWRDFPRRGCADHRGANSAIYAVMAAYLDPGSEVLLHDPCYSLYANVALAIGATAVFVSWTADLRLDMGALERAVMPRTRMFVVNHPVNPTGIVFSEAEMRAVIAFVYRHDLLLIVDEAYDHLVYDGRPMISAAGFDAAADRLTDDVTHLLDEQGVIPAA
ncbi:MAG: aminotransferase class I/II-fold pyridoxal phosphate-dependent enzyme [Acetobacteraceae bacterium]